MFSGKKRMKIFFSFFLILFLLVNAASAYEFTNLGNDFKITYPTGWTYTEEPDGTDQTFTSQTGKAWVRVVVQPSEGMTLSEIVASRKDYLNSIDIFITGEKEVTINGISGIELVFTENYKNRDYKEEQTLILSGSNYYILTVGAQVNDYPFYSEDFDRILNSFTLLKQFSPTKSAYVTPTPVETDKELSASVSLHREKTNVEVGEDVLLKLSVVNLITKPNMTVQVIIKPPSGMSVTSSEFSQSGAGQFTSKYTLKPGDIRDIEVSLKPNEAGKFYVEGWVVYYFGDNITTKKEVILNEPITVRPAGAVTSTQTPQDGGGSDGTSTIIGLFAIIAMIFTIYVIFNKISKSIKSTSEKKKTPEAAVQTSIVDRSGRLHIEEKATDAPESKEPVRMVPGIEAESAFEAEKRKQHEILPPYDIDPEIRNYLGFETNTAISMLDAEITKVQGNVRQIRGDMKKDEDVLGKLSKRLMNKEISEQIYNDLKNKYMKKISDMKARTVNLEGEAAKLKKIRSFIQEKGKYYI